MTRTRDFDRNLAQQILDMFWDYSDGKDPKSLPAKDIAMLTGRAEPHTLRTLQKMRSFGYLDSSTRQRSDLVLWRLGAKAMRGQIRAVGDGVEHPASECQGVTVYRVPPGVDVRGDLGRFKVG